MTADTITAIKKALEKVYVGEWYISGVKTNGLSVVHSASDSSMFGITAETFEAEYVVAANPFAVSELLSTLESLQSENEELREENEKLAAEVESYVARAEASESDAARLRSLIKKNWTGRCWKPVGDDDVNEVRASLSSTGDTHGN